MNPETLRKALEALEELGGELDKQNEAPNPAPAAAPVAPGSTTPEPVRRGATSLASRMKLQSELKTKSTSELMAMLGIQARKGAGTGVPFDAWLSAGGNSLASAVEMTPDIARALDSSGATPMIRQDLEPVLLELFIREFPYWERINKVPANGLVHAYVRWTGYGDAQFMSELGTVSDDLATYDRVTTPISVLATRRGVSLKAQFATLQGGAGFNPEAIEMQAGLIALAHKMQKTIFQGNATITGGAGASTENGAYDVNSFTGLRALLNTANAVNADPLATTPDDIRGKIDDAVTTVMQNAGQTGILYCDPVVKTMFDKQQDKNVRYMDNLLNVAPGVVTNAVNTVFGPLPLAVIKGDSVGSYTNATTFSAATTIGDIYALDERVIEVPYLGTEGPTVLDIPIGISGQLTHLYIIFGMWGLAVKSLDFQNKIRVRLT